MPTSEFVTLKEMRKILGHRLDFTPSRATIYHWIKTKGFPRHTGVGNPALWRRDEFEHWVERTVGEKL